MGCTPALGYKV